MMAVRNFGFLFFIGSISIFLFGVCAFHADAAEVYPTKPIRVIIPFSAGGSSDIAVRRIAPYVQKYLNQPIIIENVPGADGSIGYSRGYAANPDGYTLLSLQIATLLLSEYSGREVGYKVMDFKPIYAYARDSVILVVHPDCCNTFDEFVKKARTQTVLVGRTGVSTTTGLTGMLLVEELGLKVNWVPFGGGAQSLISLAGKHIDAVFTVTASALSLSKAGKIRPLAVFSDKRNPQYPDVPVPNELGVNIPLLFNHTGVVGPPGLPEDKKEILARAFTKAGEDPEYVENLKATSASEHIPLSVKEFEKEFNRMYSLTRKYKKYLQIE